jgi:hypothetical protein
VRVWLRWTDRLFGALMLVFAVTSTIGCVVVVVTGHWAQLPGQLVIAVTSIFLFLVRRRAWSTRPVAEDVSADPEDQGWQLRPGALGAYLRPSRPSDSPRGGALTVMRYAFLAFTGTLVSFVIVIANLPDTRTGSPLPWLLALGGITFICVVIPSAVEKSLDDSSAAKLFASYRTRFFLRIAFGQTIALFSFTFAFIGAPPWIYYVGCAISLVRLWTNAAPTRAVLARDQAALTARGSELSLVATLCTGSILRT